MHPPVSAFRFPRFSRSRYALRLALLLFPAIACWDIASGLEHWPFSNYPMYSLAYSDRLSTLRLYAVSASGEVEIRDYRNFAPFDPARLQMALERLYGQGKAPAALEGLMQLYRLRHPGEPRIQGLRLYRASWNLKPGLSGAEPPAERTLIASTP